ncbi:hypothetical protein OY671_010834, partial [Metschnikowia pulcherrima]
VVRVRRDGAGARHPHGHLHRAQAPRRTVQDFHGDFAGRHLAADLPHRHPADPVLRRAAAMAAQLRARRRGRAGSVDHGLFDQVRPAGADHAGDHAGAVPDDPDHAAGARRNAGGAARRLHQVRARPRPAGAPDQFPPRAQEHHGAGHHHHRPAARFHHRLRHHHRDGVPV